MKMTFLVAIPQPRVSELAATMADSPYMIFHKDKVSLWLHSNFLPKRVSEFHLKQCILPVFCPQPLTSATDRTLQSLDIHHALAFYLHRTRPFGKKLSVAITEYSKPSHPNKFPNGSRGASANATTNPTYHPHLRKSLCTLCEHMLPHQPY